MKHPSIGANILKRLLSLTLLFPEENTCVWITLPELRERLVHAGVHRSLFVEILQYTMTRINKGNFMDMRPNGGISYYRPLSCQMKIGTPLDQRARLSRFSNRLPILTSEMDYLKRHPDASAKLQHVNEALMQYSQDMKVYRKTKQHEGREKAAKEKEAQEKATKEKEFQEMAAK